MFPFGSIVKLMTEGKLTQGHGRALLSLKNEREQKAYVGKVLNEGATVRDIERAAKKKDSREIARFADAEETLTELLGTRVAITCKGQKGKIIIEFFSEQDLVRVVETITNIKQ